jgi:glycosyltransferase involved in cell wall biosynthesis
VNIFHGDQGRIVLRFNPIGKGPAVASLKDLARELGIAENVCFTGWVDYEKVPRYLAATDICVVPDPASEYNNHSTIVKVMEYMAQAKPVVAFDLPEHRVSAGDTALYAKPNDEADFARQIVRLMDDAELRRSLGEAGRERVAKHFTWERQVEHLLAAYRALERREGKFSSDSADSRELASTSA